jgi:alanyl-tRNA synthetase
VLKNTDLKHQQKMSSSQEIIGRYLKKLNNPNRLTGEQIWKLFKGDGSGEEISIEFIKQVCDDRKISLDLESYDKILFANQEKSLKNLKNTRKDNSSLIELANQIKKLPKTDNSHKYSFILDDETKESKFSGKSNLQTYGNYA